MCRYYLCLQLVFIWYYFYADNLTDEAWQAGEISHGNDGNSVVKVVSLIAGIDHPKVGQVQIFQGDQHWTAPGRGIGIFQLETEPFAPRHYQKVQFGTGMGRQEIGVACFEGTDSCRVGPR